MLRGEAGQGNRQIKPHSYASAPPVLEAVHQFVGFIAPFTGQYLFVFKGRSVDRTEAVRTINLPGSVDQLFTRHHGLGQVIPKTS